MKEKNAFQWEDIDIKWLLRRIIKDGWIAIVVALSITLLYSVVLKVTHKAQYTASVTFAVNSSGGQNSLFNNLGTAKELASVFEEVFQSEIMNITVAEKLGVGSLPGVITTSIIDGTNLLRVHVTAGIPGDAYRTLQGVVKYYPEVSNRILGNVNLQQVEVPNVPYSESNPLMLGGIQKKVFAIAFLFVIAMLAVVFLFSGTVITEAGAKRTIDSELLGTINRERKNKTIKTRIHNTYKSILSSNPMTSYVFKENLHKITTVLGFEMKEKECKSLMVTSIAENEGKTTVAVNFALSLAAGGKRVLLVDGDFRKPAIVKMLDLPQQQEILYSIPQSKKVQVLAIKKESITKNGVVEFSILQEKITEYEQGYDVIIVDTPPMGAGRDAETIANFVDASILVVKQDCTKVPFINDGVDQLRECNALLLGYILNEVNITTFKKKYAYEYGYGAYKEHKSKKKGKGE